MNNTLKDSRPSEGKAERFGHDAKRRDLSQVRIKANLQLYIDSLQSPMHVA